MNGEQLIAGKTVSRKILCTIGNLDIFLSAAKYLPKETNLIK